ncbi:hypothetical protein [Clostridium tarantellae]|uniref:Uncharacterized protein n=1 Tax=Clostridium tarantellae TaxID=39493 RepID=A0A6I1MSA6_9CLOT|nr:hypothetical protein [Clostridium tarantellae]MPQ43149.1 hypothetical protein [Clostridium tarantellae]
MFFKYNYDNKLIVAINAINFNNISNELLEKIKIEIDLLITELYFEEININIFENSILITNKAEELEDLKDILYFLSKLQITLLLKGILINGSVTIGKDCTLLKEKVSMPRIIISKELQKYLNEYNENDIEELEFEFDEFNINNDTYDMNYLSEEKKIYTTVEEIKYLLKLDKDKILYIDYLKDYLKDYLESEKEYIKYKKENLIMKNSFNYKSDFYSYYFKNIVTEIKKVIFNGLSNNNDMNIILKYLWLKDYYNNTLYMLGANSNNKAFLNT